MGQPTLIQGTGVLVVKNYCENKINVKLAFEDNFRLKQDVQMSQQANSMSPYQSSFDGSKQEIRINILEDSILQQTFD